MTALHVSLGSLLLAVLTFAGNFLLAPSRAKQKALREELDTLAGRVSTNATALSHHELRLSGFSQQMERNADKHEERCGKIETELKQINRLSEDVATLKVKLEGQAESLKDIKETLGKMFDLLRQPSKN